MFEPTGVHTALPAADFERAKAWYAEKLGLKPTSEDPGGAWYDVAGGQFLVYPSGFAGTNQGTAMEFDVDDVEKAVAGLREKGVVFEEYDLPYMKTENGIARMEMEGKIIWGAWFKDSEGNILAIGKVEEQ